MPAIQKKARNFDNETAHEKYMLGKFKLIRSSSFMRDWLGLKSVYRNKYIHIHTTHLNYVYSHSNVKNLQCFLTKESPGIYKCFTKIQYR